MSFARSLYSFNARAAEVRASAYGVDVDWMGQTLRAVLHPVTELDQVVGGYEPGGTMKAEITHAGPQIHDRLTYEGEAWIINDIRHSASSPARILTVTRKP
jgi:hypothetical protein